MRELLSGIAEKHGTPLFAYDLDTVSSQIFRLREYLPNAVQILYSLKANPSLGLCNAIASHGLGADISSIGEALVALEAGFAPAKICVSGPYKSPES
jgi:diaminopimelate decarboxylase